MRIKNQLDVTRELEASMSEADRDLQERVLSILKGKLDVAVRKFTKLAAKPSLSVMTKFKMVMMKDALAETIVDLESWQKLYEPSWFQLVKMAPPKIDTTLKQITRDADADAEVTRPHKVARKLREAFHEAPASSRGTPSTEEYDYIAWKQVSRCNIQSIPFCSAQVARRPEGDKPFIVDPIGDTVLEWDAVDFARRFEHAEPFIFGLLSCKGVTHKKKKDGSYQDLSFVFNVPADHTVVWGLRQLLLDGTYHDSLTGRLEVARSLVTAVYYTHLYGFVHKNIRPETILTLAREEDTGPPSKAFLVGFQVIRNANGQTYTVADSTGWEMNLYRHPLRQGTDVAYYIMQHDMYSLGVCLLEIGLWSSFVTYGPHWDPRPSPALGLPGGSAKPTDPVALKDHLVKMSRSSALRSKMGTRYGEVVETCLTCLDDDNQDFGDEKEFVEGGTANVGTRYIEKVLGIMNSLSI